MMSNLLSNVHSIVVDLIRHFLDGSYFGLKDYLLFFGLNSHYYLLSCVCIAIKNENHWIRWNVPKSLSIQINRLYSYCDSNSKFNWTFYVHVCVLFLLRWLSFFVLCLFCIIWPFIFESMQHTHRVEIELCPLWLYKKGHWLLRLNYWGTRLFMLRNNRSFYVKSKTNTGKLNVI